MFENTLSIEMKKIILFSLLSLPLFYSAQTKKLSSQASGNVSAYDKKEGHEKKAKPVVIAGSNQYDILKASGKLSNYSIVANNSNLVSVNKTMPFLSAQKVTTLTPCDFPPMIGTSPFPTPSGTNVNDDETGSVSLPFGFCFYGVTYTSMNVFDNGNVQFNTNSIAFTSTGFPSTNVNMIAPFWGDGTADVTKAGVKYGKVMVDVQPTYVVITWDSLPYYQGSTVASFTNTALLNTFQLVLTNGSDPILPPGKNVGFYYRNMQWTTGNASGGSVGFPATQPGSPATVGANEGNGTDFFQMGRFGVPGAAYDGPGGNNDGISWLNGKKFFFDLCPPAGANFEPVSVLLGHCDTVRVCGNDTIFIKNTFLGPEAGQTVSVTATAASLGSAFSYSTLTNSNGGTDIYIIIDGSIATGGYHIISIAATDNGTPALTNGQQLVVYVDQGSLNNLNGSIVLTPTLGACPGGVVSASVTVSGGVPDGYLWSNNNVTSATSFTTVVAADSLIFVTLTSGQCKKTIIGDININPVPVANISGNLSFCSGNASTTILTATNTLNPASQGPHNYLWATTTGTLGSSNTASTTATGGVYTVTVTNQFGCVSVATTTVVMNETPDYTLTSSNAISGGSVYCVSQDSARIGIGFGQSSGQACGLGTGLCTTPNIVSVGSASGANTNTGYPSVFGNYDKNARHQMLYTAAELLAAGAIPGKLSSISFQVNSMQPLNTTGSSSSSTYIGTLPNYSIKLKCTTSTVLNSTFEPTGFTQVFLGNVTPTVGVNTQTFSQPYIWDGTSNLIVDVCYTRTTSLASTYYTSNPVMPYTNVGSTKCVYFNSDSSPACGNTTGTTTNNRPDIKFGNCFASQSGSQFNVVVTPTTGVVISAAHDSIMFDLPSTPGITCYMVSLVNPLGNCSKDTMICLEAIQGTTQGTLTASNYSVCPSQTLTLNAVGALETYTIQYTDDIGLQTTTVSPVTFNAPATLGAYVYTLIATGQCGGPLTVFTNTIHVIQGVTIGNLIFSQDSVCPGTSLVVSANGPILPTYTITYGTSTGTASVVGNSVTVTPTLTTAGYQTYTLTAEGACGGPITDFVDSVQVYLGTTQATVTASADTLCPGSPITLNYTGVLATYTVTYSDASGAHTSTTVPVTYTPMAMTNPTLGYVTYTLTGQGPCNGPVTSFVDSVFIKQGVTTGSLVVSQSTVCPGTPITLSSQAGFAVASYTIAYVDANGNPQVAPPNSSVTFVPASVASPVFGPHTYTLLAEGPCSGPLTPFYGTVNVMQGITSATLAPTQSVVCIGSPISLNVTGTSLSTYTIQYNNGAGIITSNTSVTFNSAVPGLNTYTLIAQGPCSAPTAMTTASVMVNALTTLTIAPMANQVKCLNGTVTLSANVVPSSAQPFTYTWLPTVGTNTNSTYTTSTPVTQTFVVLVNGVCASPATASVVVSNFASNISVVIPDSAAVCADTDLELHSIVTGGKAPYSYNWTIFPDVNSISSSATLNTTSPGTEGVYSIMVTSTDSCGFTDSDMQLIYVLPPCGIEIGNIITPNGDGVNDLFKIKNIEYHPNSSLTIFDRWGRKVFSSSNYANEWKAEGLNDGTYFYILDVPEDKKYNGFVQVLR
ncbi:MAG: hypothetical protein K0S26_2875 [Bacteroidota bacterium]|jgi:gliding motility-associated-like protein|nr:hypothetical protein [Bacteroidota bacterium]